MEDLSNPLFPSCLPYITHYIIFLIAENNLVFRELFKLKAGSAGLMGEKYENNNKPRADWVPHTAQTRGQFLQRALAKKYNIFQRRQLLLLY
jgi:hypothetical protein